MCRLVSYIAPYFHDVRQTNHNDMRRCAWYANGRGSAILPKIASPRRQAQNPDPEH
jgi:hypothetical protein